MKELVKDVVVIGGGTSGWVAAVAAARNGADVLLVEEGSCLGGTMTAGLVLGLCSLRHQGVKTNKKFSQQEISYADEQVVYGIAQEFVDRMVAVGAAYGKQGKATVRVLFDPEIAKWVIDQMVLEAGVNVLLCTKAYQAIMENGRVTGVRLKNGLGLMDVKAKVTIDCTGDGDIAVSAGAAYEVGRPTDNLTQPLSIYFQIGGVNIDRTLEVMKENIDAYGSDYVEALLEARSKGLPLTLLGFRRQMEEALKNGDFPLPYGIKQVNPKTHFGIARPIYKNGKIRYEITSHNIDMAYYVNAIDTFQLTQATIAMRDVAVRMAEFYRKYIPGYEDSYLLQTASMVGVRETRRITGDYILKYEDVIQGQTFTDAVGRIGSVIDIHDIDGGEKPINLSEVGGQGWYHVPYRILLPQNIEGLLIAGRCVSSDYLANGSIRQQAGCMVTGQAAGVAAAIAAKGGITPREVNVEELQKRLVLQGVLI
ncbi:FAD-dependent oxidoreductase [Neomoorella humiferrea]|uniref:FAD-dependent oxidoreductase n=1 Tax=Neomoorella humiferrea TaxID=676965 RepID=UPI003D921A79